MIIKDLRNKSSADLKLLVVQLRTVLMENRFKAAQGQLNKPHVMKEVRKLIARALTVLHERNEPMETGDWHKYTKMMQEELAKKQEQASEAEKANTPLKVEADHE